MTVTIKIGRRVPRNWFRRSMHKVGGLLTFQENLWLIIERSVSMAKKKATQAGTLSFVKRNYREVENINFDLEWIEIVIKGNPIQEEEEYNEANQIYTGLGKLFKKDLETNEMMSKRFMTKTLTDGQLKKIYSAGIDKAENKTIAQKLLDLGIVTYIEWIRD